MVFGVPTQRERGIVRGLVQTICGNDNVIVTFRGEGVLVDDV